MEVQGIGLVKIPFGKVQQSFDPGLHYSNSSDLIQCLSVHSQMAVQMAQPWQEAMMLI